MLGFGNLVSTFIWLGLVFGMIIFVLTSTLLVFILICMILKLEDYIRLKRKKIHT